MRPFMLFNKLQLLIKKKKKKAKNQQMDIQNFSQTHRIKHETGTSMTYPRKQTLTYSNTTEKKKNKKKKVEAFTHVFPLILNHVSAHCLWAAPKSPLQAQPSSIGTPASIPPSKPKWQILQSLSTLPTRTFISRTPRSKSASDKQSDPEESLREPNTPSISSGECHDWSSESPENDKSLLPVTKWR
jgi:hypothetical protein